MSTITIGPLDKSEIKPAVFSFTNELETGETMNTATVTVTLVSGTDATPSGLLTGTVTIDNTNKLVSQKVTGVGRDGNTYNLRCVATTNLGNAHTVAADMQVVSL